jgi:hypothetical protein
MACVELPTLWQISSGTCDLPCLLRRTIQNDDRIHVDALKGLLAKLELSCDFST